jgi:hypothetical protein
MPVAPPQQYDLPHAPIILGIAPQPRGATGPYFTQQGPASSNYLVQATADFSTSTNWQPTMYFPAAILPLILSDPAATNFTHRYYRAPLQ